MPVVAEDETEAAAAEYERAVDLILAAGKPVGIVSGTVADGAAAIERGFRCIGYSFDLWLYEDALEAGIGELRAKLRSDF